MKNRSNIIIIGGIVILVIGAIGLGVHFSNSKNNDVTNGQEGMINLQLFGSYTVDASGVREYFSLLKDVPLIGFFQIYDSDDLLELAEVIDLELPDGLDFIFDDHQDKYMLLTFGRQLVEIRYEYRESYYDYDVPFTEITFTEEHHDQTMYVYIMDNIMLWPADFPGWDYNSFYVMNGTERIYIGTCLQNFNKQSPSFEEGL